jgi:hypothetical protein
MLKNERQLQTSVPITSGSVKQDEAFHKNCLCVDGSSSAKEVFCKHTAPAL